MTSDVAAGQVADDGRREVGLLVLLTLWGAFLVTAFIVLNTTQSQSDACSRAPGGIVDRVDCR